MVSIPPITPLRVELAIIYPGPIGITIELPFAVLPCTVIGKIIECDLGQESMEMLHILLSSHVENNYSTSHRPQ